MDTLDAAAVLADDDLEVLMDALEAWENKDTASDMVDSLLEAVIVDRRSGMPPEILAKRGEEKRNKDLAKRMRKERSVLLRAKLLQIRDRRRADHMTRDVLRTAD